MKQQNMTWICVILLVASVIAMAGPYHPGIQYIFPLPDSKHLLPETTVILRLEEAHRTGITDLSALIRVSAHSGNPASATPVAGSVIRSTDEKTLIFKPAKPFSHGQSVLVSVQTSQVGLGDYQYAFHVVNSGVNLPKASEFESDVPGRQLGPYAAPRIVNGVVLPSDFPEIQITKHGDPAPGYFTAGASGYIIMSDYDGNPYYYHKLNGAKNVLLHFTDDHPEGLMSIHLGANPGYVIYNHHFEHIDTYHAGHGYTTDNHELEILPDGHVAIIGQQQVKMDVSGIVPGGRTDATVNVRCFQELDRDHNVVFEWRFLDHHRIEEADDGTDLKGGNLDPSHMNSIDLDYDGHYIISSKTQNEITKINRLTGEVIWRFSGPNNQFTVLNDPNPLPSVWQHDVRHVPGYPNEYTWFDNRNYGKNINNLPEEAFSRVVRYKLNPENMTAELLWSYRPDPDNYCYGKCAAQALSNGNYYIDWTNKSPLNKGGNIFGMEVTPAGELVHEVFMPKSSSYRTRHYEWDACLLKPELIVENYGKTIRLIYNQFGDKNVASYNVYYGITGDPANLLMNTADPWADIPANQFKSGATYYFGVKSVNKSGAESDMSNVESTLVSYFGTGGNMVFNGDFSQGFDFWQWNANGETDADKAVNEDGELHVRISKGGAEADQIQVLYPNLTLVSGRTYRFEFDAYADGNRLIEAEVKQSRTPFASYSNIGTTALRRQSAHFAYEFNMQGASDSRARIVLDLGNSDTDVYIDNVSLMQVTHSDVEGIEIQPAEFGVEQNFPNPFNPSTAISYQLSAVSRVRLEVYEASGRLVSVLADEEQAAGRHEVVFDGSDLASGVYFYRIEATGMNKRFVDIRKMILLK